MDRYQDANSNHHAMNQSRLSKNEELYQDLGRTMKYTSFTTEIPTVELDATKKNYKTREGYQQMKEYSDFFEEEIPTAKKELKEFKELYDVDENRIYDINSILEQAKKERNFIDEREKKRKLKNEKYNITATMDENEVKAIKNRKKMFEEEEQEELQELIDTITSHELREKIDASRNESSLLSDLMATSVQDQIDSKQKNDENLIEDTSPYKGITDPKLAKEIDASFYTKSMDLSDKDFDLDDEMEEEFKESKGMLFLKLFFLLLLLIVVVVGSYFIVKSF